MDIDDSVPPRRPRSWLAPVAALTLASGWIGAGVNVLLGRPHAMDSPGAGVWLVTPLTLVLATRFARRTAAPGRWRPRLRQAWPVYAIGLAAFPAVTAVTVAVSKATGSASLDGFRASTLLPAVGGALGVGLVKNVFEESVWRGYFVGELDARRASDVVVYLGSGLVWALWHVPYYLFFLPHEDMRRILDVPPGVFALAAGGAMLGWSVLFTELYRLGGSVWPLVLLHAVEDALINPLVIEGHVTIQPGAQILVSPIVGLLPTTLYVAIGLALRHRRLSGRDKKPAPRFGTERPMVYG